MEPSFTFGCLEGRLGYEKTMDLIAEAGYRAFDYDLDQMVKDDCPLNGDGWRERAEAIRRAADARGLRIGQTHAPFSFSLKLWEDPEKYETVVNKRIKRAIEITGIFGAYDIVIHPLHHFEYHGREEEIFNMNMAYYRELLPLAKAAGVRIGVENMWRHDPKRRYIVDDTCSRSDEFCRYIDTLNDPYAVATLDVGHVGLILRDDEAQDVVRALGHDRLHSLHIHDNDYRGDQHLLPMQGKMKWPEICRALGEIDYDGDFTYECGGAFFANVDDGFLPTAIKYTYDLGKYLCDLVDRYRPVK